MLVLGLGLGLDSVGRGQMLSRYTPVSITYATVRGVANFVIIVIFLGVYCLAFFFVNVIKSNNISIYS